jgi:hypothetical protein
MSGSAHAGSESVKRMARPPILAAGEPVAGGELRSAVGLDARRAAPAPAAEARRFAA